MGRDEGGREGEGKRCDEDRLSVEWQGAGGCGDRTHSYIVISTLPMRAQRLGRIHCMHRSVLHRAILRNAQHLHPSHQ